MFRILLLLFILVPIIEIAVFIQVGDILGLGATLFIVVLTAILGVNLLKQQGLKAWQDIQLSMAQGQAPAKEMASAAQLLFAGGLLLTPGFVTDVIGFTLMIPQVRTFLAARMMRMGNVSVKSQTFHYSNRQSGDSNHNRTIEGEFEEKK